MNISDRSSRQLPSPYMSGFCIRRLVPLAIGDAVGNAIPVGTGTRWIPILGARESKISRPARTDGSQMWFLSSRSKTASSLERATVAKQVLQIASNDPSWLRRCAVRELTKVTSIPGGKSNSTKRIRGNLVNSAQSDGNPWPSRNQHESTRISPRLAATEPANT